MNHKLRVLVRVGSDPGQVTLETTGCLTQASYPSLLHILRRASRLAGGSDLSIDLREASHLDPEILLDLRQLAATPEPGDVGGGFRLFLREPADLPICLHHVGSGDEVLAGLNGAGIGTGGSALVDGLELSDYVEGALDPGATVKALSDAALGQLADALYQHLDTPNPSFGAHTWYELAAEELHRRHQAPGTGAPAENSLTAGPALS